MAPIVLSSDFGYVLLASALISTQCSLSVRGAAKLRREFDIKYPDTGNGRHSQKLSDEQWERFNNAQRVHLNYVEHIGTIQPLLWAAGVVHPTYAGAFGFSYIVGRELYGYGYQKSGPKGRISGFLVWQLSTIGLLGLAIHGSVKLLGFL
ncbi:Microsomal glutathione S-transferase 3 [Entomophthora muscae]|uniref:Microsomal glutathione S-transferase 3 n=2 Tax=Entomophthora muscae TaxID=34485 RepID=A0ACC2U7R2_9FUNG|nr:Microsomal glutathione S-transferase 3 [Entomophthora muscae]KAJ9083079.1 Microsomal glutathione S-transferase 3 [Entomophthora muscae]